MPQQPVHPMSSIHAITFACGLSAATLAGAQGLPNGTTNMTVQANKAVVRGYLDEVVNRGNLAAFDRYFAPGVVFNGSTQLRPTLERMSAIQSAFPDHTLVIEEQVAEGDKVATRVTFRGTHLGPFAGIAPSGRHVTYSGLAIDRVVDGKVVEMWHSASVVTMLVQLRTLLSAPPP
jgi:predicted ester cyclase